MRVLLVIATAVFIILYIKGLNSWLRNEHWKVSKSSLERIIYSHIVAISLLAIEGFISYFYSISFRGHQITLMLALIAVLSGISVYPLGSWVNKRQFSFQYFRCFSYLPVVFALFLYVPVYGLLTYLHIIIQLTGPVDAILYEDKNIRAQVTHAAYDIGYPMKIDVFEKKGVFEFHAYRTRSLAGCDSISVNYFSDTAAVTIFQKQVYEVVDTTLKIKI